MKSRKKIHAYWRNPDEGINSPKDYLRERTRQRTITLVKIIERLPITTDARILEIGCNVGRNLEGLRIAGYSDLYGIDINKEAIALMRKEFPKLSVSLVVAPVEEKIREISDNYFDLVFTMAVLQHLHPKSKFVFAEMARITKYLITVEDEHSRSWRHKPRDYGRVFSKLGMVQIGKGAIKGLSSKFVGRAFRKEV